MKKSLIIIPVAIILLLAAYPALASVVGEAKYNGKVRVTDNGTSTATAVSANFTLNSASFISNGFASENLSDIAIQINGADTAFMPSANATYPWAMWISEIGAGQNIDYDLYSVNVTGGKIRYFPGPGGMTTTDSANLELGDNFTIEQSGWVNIDSGYGKDLVHKPDAFRTYVSEAGSGNITSAIMTANTTWTSPTGFIDGSGLWGTETNAYDENTGTFATSTPTAGVWSEFLELTLSAYTTIDRLRYYVSGQLAPVTPIDVDFYYNGAWHDVYQGAATQSAWETQYNPDGYQSVNSTRIRLFNTHSGSQNVQINEVDFGADNVTASVTATGVSSGEHTVRTTAEDDIRLDFDGNDYVDMGNDSSLRISGAITIEVWVKTSANGPIVAKTAYSDTDFNYMLEVGAFYVSDSTGALYSLSFPTSADDNNWHHVVGIYDGTDLLGYLDGEPNGSNNIGSITLATTGGTSPNMYLGRRYYSSWAYLTGLIDEVRIYSRALNATEIEANYKRGKISDPQPQDSTGLAGWWHIDEGTGSTLDDETANNNNGSISGATWDTGTGLTIYVDGTGEDSAFFDSISVPDNATNWTFLQNDVMPYMEYARVTVSGVLQQDIEWEYGSTFTDRSGNGHDATPSFRTTSSDANVSALLVSFGPVTEAKVSTFTLGDVVNILTGTPESISQLYTELDFTHIPGAEAINEVLAEGDIPQALWWFPVLYISIVIIGFITYGATRLGGGNGSLLAMVIVCEALIGLIGLMNPVPFWPALLFPIPAVAILISQKHFSWG